MTANQSKPRALHVLKMYAWLRAKAGLAEWHKAAVSGDPPGRILRYKISIDGRSARLEPNDS